MYKRQIIRVLVNAWVPFIVNKLIYCYLNGSSLDDRTFPFLLARNCKYWDKSPISPYSIMVQGGCSAVQTPSTLQILGSDKLARKRTSLSDSIELGTVSFFVRSVFGVLTATNRPISGIISSNPSVSCKLICKLHKDIPD